MLLISFCVSLLLLLLVCADVGRTGGGFRAVLYCLGGIVVGFGCMMPTLLVHATVLGIVIGLIAPLAARRRPVIVTAVVVTLGVFGFVGYWAHLETKDAWNPVREQYPFESLQGRLADLNAGKGNPVSLPEGSDGKLGQTWSRLAEVESDVSGKQELRARSLEMAHSGFVKRFVNADGFGAGRMIGRASPYYAKHPDEPGPLLARDYTISLRPLDPKTDYPTPAGVHPTGVGPAAEEPILWSMHSHGLMEFVNPQGFGLIHGKDRVAGFRPHQFRRIPDAWQRAAEPWRLERLELVGLLKHQEPRAYVSENLPSMAAADQLPTRSLDLFERSALPALQRGEDVARERKGDQLRVLGSIRAGQVCLKCHDARRGDLLGAFSYVLRKEPSPR